MSVELNLGHWQ